MTKNPKAKDIHQRILFIRFVEVHFSANRRNPDAISVVRNPGHHPRKQSPVLFHCGCISLNWTEPQRVQEEHWTSAHGEDIADDPSDPRCRTLERFNRAGVIMTFHLEGNGPTITNIYHARVFFSRLHQDLRSGGRKFSKFESRVFIRAMLAPHHREDAKLGIIWIPAQNGLDPFVLHFRQTVIADYLWRNLSKHL